MIPLLLAADIFFAGLAAQRVQHPPDHLGALAGQVPVQQPGAAERSRQLHAAVGEVPVRVLIGPLGPGPLVHLREQRRQLLQPQPPGGRRDQGLVSLVPGLVRQLVRPHADQPPHRLRDLPGGQRGQHPRMGGGPLGPRGVPDRGAPGNPGAVDQPGHRAVLRVAGIAPPGGERGQEQARAAVAIASACSSSRRHSAWVAAGSWVASAAARYPSPARTMSSASRVVAGAVPTGLPPCTGTGRCWRRFSSPGGRLLGSEFDSIPRLRHFRGKPRHSAKSVRMT